MQAIPLSKLIKSSIYSLYGQPVRYTGETRKITVLGVELTHHVFRSHRNEYTAPLENIQRATKQEIAAYLGK